MKQAAASQAIARWTLHRLGDLVTDAQSGFASGERSDSGVAQLRMNNVTDRGTFDWSTLLRVPASRETVGAFSLERGDVLFNNTNSAALVGKSALFEGFSEEITFSNHFTRLRTAQEHLLPEFLAYWLQLQWKRRVFENICNRWIGQSAVQREKLLSLQILLPSLDEQRLIASAIRGKFEHIEKARAAATAQMEAAKALPAAYLREVFQSPEAKYWACRALADVAELLPSKSIATAGDTAVRAITTACLTERGFEPDGIKDARMWADDAAQSIVKPGEVLIARSNTAELVGRAATYNGVPGEVVASDLTIRIMPHGDVLASDFLGCAMAGLATTAHENWAERLS